mmetsp:Transcript_13682/g.35128  ORF Transcript_13682/g.35128 Transcript_13682/m.35128 type:complete len:97 (-) Transcript_13682:275-565(-)
MADVKPDIKPIVKAPQIEITVKSPDNEIKFKVRMTTEFTKIKKAYCEKMALTPHNVRFLFDGANIPDNGTPASVGLDDGDMIDVYSEATGGCSHRE